MNLSPPYNGVFVEMGTNEPPDKILATNKK